jgi:hypothetical protein
VFLFQLGFQQSGPGITVQRLLQHLLERQDDPLLAQAQGFVLVQIAGHDHRAESQQHQRQNARAPKKKAASLRILMILESLAAGRV